MEEEATLINCPYEYSMYVPLFAENEIGVVKKLFSDINAPITLDRASDILLESLDLVSQPSDMFLYALAKILYHSGKNDVLMELHQRFNENIGIELWLAKLLVRKGLIDEGIRIASLHVEGDELPIIFRLNAALTIAMGYLYLGNQQQAYIYLEKIFAETLNVQSSSSEEKRVLNDVILEAQINHILLQRHNATSMKLENNIQVALNIANEIKERNHIASLYNLLGLVYRDAGKIEKAIEAAKNALELAMKIGNKRIAAIAKGNLGKNYLLLNKLNKAEEYLYNALEDLQALEENRNIAYIRISLGDLALKRENISQAIHMYRDALALIEKLHIKETLLYCSLAELYLYNNDFTSFKIIYKQLEEECDREQNPAIYANIKFLKGLFNQKKLNFGEAIGDFNEALNIADRIGREELSAKVLVNLGFTEAFVFIINGNDAKLSSAIEHLEQVLTFFKENRMIIEQITILQVESLILALLDKRDEAFNRIQMGLELTEQIVDKNTRKSYQEACKKIEVLIEQELIDKSALTKKLEQQLKEIEAYGLKFMMKTVTAPRLDPLALLILHQSGIPIRAYVITKKTVRNKLLFGGFITAIKDMLNDLFREEKFSRIMVITYGNHKILIETNPKGYSVVIISTRDSFLLRRKIRELSRKLENIKIPEEFYGELPEETITQLDSTVDELFEQKLTFSEIIE